MTHSPEFTYLLHAFGLVAFVALVVVCCGVPVVCFPRNTWRDLARSCGFDFNS